MFDNPILSAAFFVSSIGLFAGLGLSVASKIMAVPKDLKADEITEILPGINCGACGYAGCLSYAAALSCGECKETNLCAPGGNTCSNEIAMALGLAAGIVPPSSAVVLCQGKNDIAEVKMNYVGVESCRIAKQLFGGPKECVYGCIGLGDCEKACPYEAIHMCDGVARVNPKICKACKLCVKTCPNDLIEMLPLNTPMAAVLCKNLDKGAATKKQCKAGCIGCMRCVKVCEDGAVTVTDNCAYVDFSKCTGCRKCREVCPTNSIDVISISG
ncbi:MAG: RnfABCDGE type electron transport complex subunit B [Oscillospiraceae bacterium]|nr:RnfABCDGE type electron transport complex subunit B [Oscillospiraceae bacterium]